MPASCRASTSCFVSEQVVMAGTSPAMTPATSRRRFMSGHFGLIERDLFAERLRDARTLLQPRVVGLNSREVVELHGCRHAPVQHCIEIRVGDREPIEQEFAAVEMVIEIRKPRLTLCECVPRGSFRRFLVE